MNDRLAREQRKDADKYLLGKYPKELEKRVLTVERRELRWGKETEI